MAISWRKELPPKSVAMAISNKNRSINSKMEYSLSQASTPTPFWGSSTTMLKGYWTSLKIWPVRSSSHKGRPSLSKYNISKRRYRFLLWSETTMSNQLRTINYKVRKPLPKRKAIKNQILRQNKTCHHWFIKDNLLRYPLKSHHSCS